MENNNGPKEESMAMQIFDIAFIFILAFICLVVPTEIQGAVLVGWDESGAIGFLWDPVGYFGLLAIIMAFFIIVLSHSVKNYKY